MVSSEKHQKALLGGIERLAGVMHPELVPAIPKILMAFYQTEILEEDIIKQWGTHVSKKYVDKETSKKVRKASEPFLKVRVFIPDTGMTVEMPFCSSGSMKRKTTRTSRTPMFSCYALLL